MQTKGMKDDKQSAIPSIETEILTVLDPAQRENALAFTAYLRENVREGDIVVTMGAGDIFRAGEALISGE